MDNADIEMKISVDMSVIQPLIDRLEGCISQLPPSLKKRSKEAFQLLFNSGKLFSEMTTVQSDHRGAGTRNLLVTFYPTDCFLVFSRTIFAWNIDGLIIKNRHKCSSVTVDRNLCGNKI